MAVFVFYDLMNGRETSVGTGDPPAPMTPEVLAARQWGLKLFPEMAGAAGFVWNPATLDYDPAPDPATFVDAEGTLAAILGALGDYAVAKGADQTSVDAIKTALSAATVTNVSIKAP